MIYTSLPHSKISNANPRSTTRPTGFTHSNVKSGAQAFAEAYQYMADRKRLKSQDLGVICNVVCQYFNERQPSEITLNLEVLQRKSRKREIVKARQVFMYLAKKTTKYSLKVIGNYVDGFDHTTVIHSCITVQNLIDTDAEYKQIVTDIENSLK